jgi:hypothetical protein
VTILIKSTSVFFLFFGMAGVVLTEYKLSNSFRELQIWIIAALASAPALLYHLYEFFITGNLQGQLKGRLFNPALWADLQFYLDWLSSTSKVMGHLAILVIALIGLFLIKAKISQRFLLGSWFGFVIYGFAVSYYVTTHSYYLLPVIPLGAITIGAMADWLFKYLERIKLAGLVWVGTAAALVLGVGLGYHLYSLEDYRHEPDYYAKIASYVDPEDEVLALSQDYGFRLAYYGWRHVQPWDRLERLLPMGEKVSEQNPYSSMFATAMKDYDFFIITRMKDFREQTDLNLELTNHYPVHVEGGGYVIFDLRERLD